MKVVRSFWLWAGAFVVVLVLSVANVPGSSSAASRVAHLETLVRCPSCEDLSVAVSNATSAIAVRHEIAADVRAGKSDNQILTSLEDAYGSSILLSPPTSGLGVLLWAVPLGVVLVGVGAAVRIWRRRT
jgi:cytochrome c-type biogenesis protein CcmH